MAFMLDDIKSFAKHIQESGTDAEDCVENILKELDVPYSRPRGVGLKIDYMIEFKQKNRSIFMIDVDNIINLLREAIEEEDWRIVEQVLEILNVEIDNPFDE